MVSGKNDQKLVSRRRFVKGLGWVFLIPVAYLWMRVIKQNDLIDRKKNLKVSLGELSEGINFLDTVIIIKKGDSIEVFSAKCTHLGCMINRKEGDMLVCPCHGSRYDESGHPVKGPSVKSLKKLKYISNDETKEIMINFV